MTWSLRWGYQVKSTPATGVLETPTGFLIHGKVGGPAGRRRVQRHVACKTLREAQRERLEMLSEARSAASCKPSSRPLFCDYAVTLFETKKTLRELKSAMSRQRWEHTIRLHLIPHFGLFAVDAIDRAEIDRWKLKTAKNIARGTIRPSTANGWLSILRVILRAAVDEFELDKDPTMRVRDFSTAEHPTYTDEEPNALSPTQVRAFLHAMRKLYPQFYALTLLGFVTGLRPSSLRPLRRSGPEADVLWDEGTILVRRSHSLGRAVMNTTKTDNRYRLGLPPEVMAELAAHVERLHGARARPSELLFPSRGTRSGATPSFIARSCLDRPFVRISKAIGLPFRFTPRGLRRTFQDLGRAQRLEPKLRMAICGHETEKMSELYSSISLDEMRAGVSAIVSLVTAA